MKKILMLIMMLSFMGCAGLQRDYKENEVFTEAKEGTVKLRIERSSTDISGVDIEGVNIEIGKDYYVVPSENLYIGWYYEDFNDMESNNDEGDMMVNKRGWRELDVTEDQVLIIEGEFIRKK